MNGVREDMVWRVATKELLEREEIFKDLLYSTKVQHLDCPHLRQQSVYFAMRISNKIYSELACWNTALYTTKLSGVPTLHAIFEVFGPTSAKPVLSRANCAELHRCHRAIENHSDICCL